MESFYFIKVPQSFKAHTSQFWVSLDFMGQYTNALWFCLTWYSVWDINSSLLSFQNLWHRTAASLEKSTCLFRYLWIIFQYWVEDY